MEMIEICISIILGAILGITFINAGVILDEIECIYYTFTNKFYNFMKVIFRAGE